jgi:hypothetical protein
MIDWFLVDWPVWFVRVIAAFLASASAAYFYVTVKMIQRPDRASSMLWPVFCFLGCIAAITIYDFIMLPHQIDLAKVPIVMWLRIVLNLSVTVLVWRFILYIKGAIN